MEWIKKYFKRNKGYILDNKYYQKYPEIEFNLYLKDVRKNQLPLKKIIALTEKLKLKYEYNCWDYSDEFTFEIGLEKVKKFDSKQFSRRTHWIYNSKKGRSDEYLILQTITGFILPNPYVIRFKTPIEKFDPSNFDELFNDKDFVCAYAVSELDNFIQNAPSVQYYEFKDVPFDKKRVIKSNDKYTPDEMDLTGNPGRSRQAQNMILMSCWRMWFSENYFEVVPKEKIENFEGAKVNTILENGLHFIELYESPFDAAKPESRAIQKKFNEWIDIEGLYKEHSEKYCATI
jgi:hypothetical protein